jgi:hypothetical protein
MALESLDVIISVGEVAERIDVFPPHRGEPEGTVTLTFGFGDHATVSLAFTASDFLALAERLSRFAHEFPGRPS